MKAFVCFAAVLAAASAAPQVLVGHGLGHHGHAVVGGQTSHQSVSTAHGEQRTLVQSKAFGATHSSVAQSDNSKGLSEIQPSIAANRPVPVGHAAVAPLAHAFHAAPLSHAIHGVAPAFHSAPLNHAVHGVAPAFHSAPLNHAVHGVAPAFHAAPLAHHGLAPAFHSAPLAHHGLTHAVHAAPLAHAVHAPVVAHAVHAAPVVHAVAHAAPLVHATGYAQPDLAEVSPYTYNYGVADDYSKAAFSQSESNDGTGVVQGSYSVNLPDGRVQTVTYHANDAEGYVAEVSYSGEAVYPEAVAAPVVRAVHAAPLVHAVHAAPLVHAVHAAPLVVAHQG